MNDQYDSELLQALDDETKEILIAIAKQRSEKASFDTDSSQNAELVSKIDVKKIGEQLKQCPNLVEISGTIEFIFFHLGRTFRPVVAGILKNIGLEILVEAFLKADIKEIEEFSEKFVIIDGILLLNFGGSVLEPLYNSITYRELTKKLDTGSPSLGLFLLAMDFLRYRWDDNLCTYTIEIYINAPPVIKNEIEEMFMPINPILFSRACAHAHVSGSDLHGLLSEYIGGRHLSELETHYLSLPKEMDCLIVTKILNCEKEILREIEKLAELRFLANNSLISKRNALEKILPSMWQVFWGLGWLSTRFMKELTGTLGGDMQLNMVLSLMMIFIMQEKNTSGSSTLKRKN